MIFSEKACDWLSRATGIAREELHVTPLKGANSSAVFLVRGAREAFVLRVLDNREWLAEEPDLAQHEAAALQEVRRTGVPAPQIVGYSVEDAGFGGPVVLMTYLEGEVELRPTNFDSWLRALAQTSATVHQHAAEAFAWRFESWVNETILAPPPWTTVPRVWEKAIELWRAGPPESRAVFIHRDYHPANVLWRGDAVSGVVDWINACRGPAGVDVAHCRTNFVWMYGGDVAERFLQLYLELSGQTNYEYYWDIDSVFDMSLPEPEFYRPWREFGLEQIALEVLRRRTDEHLARVVENAGF